MSLQMRGAQICNESLTIFGEAAREMGGCSRSGGVLQAPASELEQNRQQVERFLGRCIDHAPRLGRIYTSRDEACGFEQFQPTGEDVRRDSFVTLKKLLEVALTRNDEVAQYDERPPVPH